MTYNLVVKESINIIIQVFFFLTRKNIHCSIICKHFENIFSAKLSDGLAAPMVPMPVLWCPSYIRVISQWIADVVRPQICLKGRELESHRNYSHFINILDLLNTLFPSEGPSETALNIFMAYFIFYFRNLESLNFFLVI